MDTPQNTDKLDSEEHERRQPVTHDELKVRYFILFLNHVEMAFVVRAATAGGSAAGKMMTIYGVSHNYIRVRTID